MDENQVNIAKGHLKEILGNLKSPVIIGITGDSGSGKTTFSNGIRRLLGTDLVKTIDLDGYHTENRKQREETGHLPLDPGINRLDFLEEHLSKIKKGETIQVPIYNHATGEFDQPREFVPSPIVIIEGLHALYPQFLPFYDFSLYVDPSREVKWEWKYQRDMTDRKHEKTELTKEMLKREAAYKRWIDFQKTNANIVVKILKSQIKEFARYECINDIPKDSYKVELIVEMAKTPLSHLALPFDLATILGEKQPAFLLAAVPSLFWGRKAMVLHLDGEISQQSIKALEDQIISYTGIEPEKALDGEKQMFGKNHEQVPATRFSQLVITWRFLEEIHAKVG